MAHTFALTDGATTVTLSSGAYMATRWDFGDNERRDSSNTYTSTLELLVSGANIAAISSAVRAIETMLDKARLRAERMAGPRVYLRVQWDGEAEVWQTEIISGQLMAEEAADQLKRNNVEAALVIQRRFFETASWTQLTLTNQNGTNNTAGLGVYTVNDGNGTSPSKRNNYLAIDAAEVTGSLPAPVKLELANANGSATSWDRWFIAVNSFNDPANFAHMIEAESAVAGGSSTSNAAYSGGAARTYTASGTYELHYTLSAATAQDCAGYPFRVLLGFASGTTPPTGYVTVQVRDASGTVTLASGDRVQLTGATTETPIDAAVLTIPPGDYSITYGALRLVVQFFTATSQTVILDWLALFPAQSTRHVRGIVGSLASNEKLVVDESDNRSYVTDGTYEYPYALAMGQPLMLQPGVENRIYVTAARSTGTTVTDKLTARAWVKQRRLTL